MSEISVEHLEVFYQEIKKMNELLEAILNRLNEMPPSVVDMGEMFAGRNK